MNLFVRGLVAGFCVVSLVGCASTAEVKKAEAPPVAPAPEVVEEVEVAEPAAKVSVSSNVLFADIPFSPFNPKQPEGVHVYPISGNPGTGPFSAVVRFPAGLKMPLHSHKHSYTGMALSEGLYHGTSDAAAHDAPKGSSWSQPAGEAHVDGCKGDKPCYFLVTFDGPVNMVLEKEAVAEAKSHMTAYGDLKWTEVKGGVKMSVLKGNPKEGAFIALFDFPAGLKTNLHTHSASFDGLLVSGTHHRGKSEDALVTLTPNSVWHEPSKSPHIEKCGADERCVLWVSMDGPLDTEAVELTPTTK
jgi:quercetin dioxygenase-like cupin family protein